MKKEPLGSNPHYGTEDREYLDRNPMQPDLLPQSLRLLRWKLNQKAKREPKFKFYALYDRVYRPDVLAAAWKAVAHYHKASGVDGKTREAIERRPKGVEEFLEEIHLELKERRYRAQPVKRVFIPKGNTGKMRPLGIPTLKDRVVQAAVLILLEPIFEADFEECSHGFRPKRSAHQALTQIQQNLQDGLTAVYDADLKGYFDSIPHDKLMACVRMRVVDRSVLGLLQMWLNAPIVEEKEGKQQPPNRNEQGTPQGGVISPLLANIYLHWFDKTFHRNTGPAKWAKARLVRYADDFVVMARYQSESLKGWIENTLEKWLGLEINREKTRTLQLKDEGETLNFLGYCFRYEKDLKGRGTRYLSFFPSRKAMEKEREKIREMTGSKNGFKPAKEMIAEINEHLRGWKNYYRIGYCRREFRAVNWAVTQAIRDHLQRRSQRGYRRPKGLSWYQFIRQLGFAPL
jgi:RNA-directed DNA polymerase